MVLGKLSEQLQLVNFVLSRAGSTVCWLLIQTCAGLSLTEGPEKYLQQPQSMWSGKQQRIQQPNDTNYFGKSKSSYLTYSQRDKLVLDFPEGLSQDTVKNVNMSLTWVSVKYLKSLNVFFKAVIIDQKDRLCHMLC